MQRYRSVYQLHALIHPLRITSRALLFLGAAVAAFGSRADVLAPPDLRCTSVDLSGNVTLTWLVPTDPNGVFQSYEVFRATTLGGSYVNVATVTPYITTSHTDVGAGANTAARYYFVKTVSLTGDTSIASDTLATIFLNVGQSAPPGSAALDWNLPHNPALLSASQDAIIAWEFPLVIWQDLDTVPYLTHHYAQVISVCDDSLTYRISIADDAGCTSYSNFNGDVFADVTAPSPPVITSVSVDTTTNQTVFQWQPSPEGDTYGYIVVIVVGSNNVIVDTVFGQNNTTFEWASSDAASDAESWTVAAIDSCYHGTPPAPNTSAASSAHTTVHTSLWYDRCNSDVRITWSHYVGWPVDNYELYVQVDNGPLALLGTFQPTATTFLHQAVDPFRQYCYVVKAIATTPGLSSLSNKACLFTAYPDVPQWNYLRVATVAEHDHIVVIDSVDSSAPARRYHLQRTNNGGPWEEIATQPGGPGHLRVFDDLDVETDGRSYTYRVVVDDSCGVEAITSNIGTSINLVVEAGQDGIDRLRWNGYSDWAGGVTGYRVYRSIADGDFQLLTVNPSGQWELDDDVNSYIATTGKFCYYVEAVEGANPSGINATSVSNIACAIQQEAVWIPNAFIQGTTGKNSNFKPVVAYVDVKGYELIVYNRWGQEIWNTTDPNEGWYGIVDGNYVPQGVYAYYCAVLNGAGKKYEQRGTVTFLCCQE